VADGAVRVGDEGLPGGCIFRLKTLDGGKEILVAEVQDGEADVFGLLGDAGTQGGAADGEAAAAGGHDVVAAAVDFEAEDLPGVGIAAEHGADGVVRADAFEIETPGVDEAAVDLGAVGDVGVAALGAGEDLEEVGFELGGRFAEEGRVGEELVGELDDAASVGDDLDGLDAGDVVEEPAAAGVHELGVALELEEFEDGDALGWVRVWVAWTAKKRSRLSELRSRMTWM